MSGIFLTGVSKRFGDVVAVDALDLSLRGGESLVVLGPSGSGKSTLLRIIAGLETPDAGEIRIGGVLQNGLPPHRRDVAIVFQHFALYPHLSALDNITLGLRHGLRLGRQEAARRAAEVAERLAITELLHRLPRQMSGGQRQRVALARALARQAGVVLLDEPLSGLDAQLRLTLRAEIAGVLRGTGATTVHVTHDQNDAMAMADRIAVIREGRLEQLGSPDDLYRQPDSLFVAGFIGSPPMNRLTLTAVDGVHPTPFGPRRAGEHADLVLGVRPEQLKIGGGDVDGDAGEATGDSGLWRASARVTLVEHEGPSTILHLDVDGHALRARTHPDLRVSAGERIVVTADPAHMHVFDLASGRTLGRAADLLIPVAHSERAARRSR
ncbi:ABC transporter ATP-binding protein [Streptosporangium carneum]|uniref:Sugar ABC transporter ATP-binding protein n=1 Tax=Streptosporangium carneum TaxID=47481 RepID=A0A9W6I8P3_9ACTN|nr:ABC transporter ATP-binding protein [Streptosporangium carneum]GLK14145.1 sugar ABC transporter ATP-binding protein [Streptosporangium carneum]